MPITSYLIHPQEGKKNDLLNTLTTFDNCEVIPAENEDLIILVTETTDEIEEKILKEKIETIESLKMMALVAGFNSPKNN